MRSILPHDFKVIFECTAGSHLYGTNTDLSDTDIRGVFIPTKEYFFGMNKSVEQYEDKKNDIVYYDIRKFLSLASDCNPNIIELLFVPPKNISCMTNIWVMIEENKHLFLSTRARWTFSGYAMSQLHRIRKHRNWLLNPPESEPNRTDFDLPEHQKLVRDEQIGAFNKLLSMYLEQIQMFHPLRDQIEAMQEKRDNRDYISMIQSLEDKMDAETIKSIMPINENLMVALEKEKAYEKAFRHWKQYQNWKKNRNPARAELEDKYGYDTKHGAHLYRLLTQGEELLTKHTISLPRPDAELLLEIRNGKYSYDELLELIGNVDEHFDTLYKTSTLPRKSDIVKIDELCVNIVDKLISERV